MNKILPRLFLGSAKDSRNRKVLRRLKIKYILSIHNRAKPGNLPGVTYKCIQIKDKRRAKIEEHFDECIKFIHDARLKKKKVLVHCRRGKSRSATICIAYMMHALGITFKNALKAVSALRSKVSPNSGFRKKLEKFEKSLVKIDYDGKKTDLMFYNRTLQTYYSSSDLTTQLEKIKL